MSRAFVKESDAVEPLPERPVSPHPNYVTAQGLALIDAEIERLSSAHAEALSLGRDLRYWHLRRASAELIAPPADVSVVHFGARVTIRRDDGRLQTWHIVGEDEADPAKGSLSYVAPVARALNGKKVGDVVEAGNMQAEIVAIA
jgi:transcription elongation GreA/GreB family factor